MEVRARGMLTGHIRLTRYLNSYVELLLTIDATSDAVRSSHHEPGQRCQQNNIKTKQNAENKISKMPETSKYPQKHYASHVFGSLLLK